MATVPKIVLKITEAKSREGFSLRMLSNRDIHIPLKIAGFQPGDIVMVRKITPPKKPAPKTQPKKKPKQKRVP